MQVFFPLSLSFSLNQSCCYNLQEDKYSLIKSNNLKAVFYSNKILVCNKKNFLNFKDALNYDNAIDILELILFLFPNISVSPNIFSIYKFLTKKEIAKETLPEKHLIQEAKLIAEVINQCQQYIKNLSKQQQEELFCLATFLKEEDWAFADFVLQAIAYKFSYSKKYLRAWEFIKEYKSEEKESTKPVIENETEAYPIEEKDVLNTLHLLTAGFGKSRVEQAQYSSSITNMFNINKNEEVNFVFAEAGTGTGKTLGYLASVLSFIKTNPTKQVLISTYSKALQKQIIKELKEAFLTKEEYEEKVTSIKGSNNYLCLLNYKSLLDNLRIFSGSVLFLTIISRWVRVTENGDLVGGDLSPLMFEVFPNSLFNFLLNRKEECLYSKCPHFKNCFIMATKYKAKRSNIVVSNHAFSLLNSCLNIKYTIFDEAHHLFSASDDVFSMDISCNSAYFLKSWINGSNSHINIKKETNGIKTRLNTILKVNEDATEDEQQVDLTIQSFLDAFISTINTLPEQGSVDRIKNHNPKNIIEEFLYQIYLHVLKNNDDLNQYYTIESYVDHNTFSEDFLISIENTKKYLEKVLNIGSKLHTALKQKLFFVKEEDSFSLEEFIRIFESLCLSQILEYYNMIEELIKPDKLFIYRFMIEKEEGSVTNIGFYKNYIDPSQPFAVNILTNQKGVSFTSATLSDSYDEDKNFEDINRFGLNYLENNYKVNYVNIKSPFNYAENSKIIILNGNNNNVVNISNYILEIFKASGGGGLALFTAINRLRQVYKNINAPMSSCNIRLMAQHVNNQKITSLIDVFKDDTNSCLLGTDSARDGIDIPGESLRLVVFEKVPWPRPDILQKTRVNFLGKNFVDKTIRLKLRQAFGRIIRKEEDRGIFVLLQSAVPSELLKAFPKEIEVKKISIEETISTIKLFFNNKSY